MVWNKADALEETDELELVRTRGGVAVSAKDRRGFEVLLHKAEAVLFAQGDLGHAEAMRETHNS